MDGTVNTGLEGVVVAETRLSDVDGARGRLILRGRPVEELAGNVTFEEACSLFLDVTAAEATARLQQARAEAFARITKRAAVEGDPMDVVRAALAQPGPDDAWSCIAEVGVVAALAARVMSTSTSVSQCESQEAHARALLRIAGLDAGDASTRALDAYLVAVIDHGMNASTFAARVVASTGSDLRSCVVAGLGALKGPLHGGAPGPVLDMLDAIARTMVGSDAREHVRAWLESELSQGRRIMGMGHRVYRVRDPRAEVLERALDTLTTAAKSDRRRTQLGRVVEREAERLLAERTPSAG